MPDLKNLLQKVTTKMIFPKLLSFKEKDEDFSVGTKKVQQE